MIVDGFGLSPRTASLLFLPIDHLMSGTLLAADPERVPADYREEYAEQVWDPGGSYLATCRKLNGTTCAYCNDDGWVSDGRWHFLTNDAVPCTHCDMLARRHRNEKLLLAYTGLRMVRPQYDLINLAMV